MAAGRARGGAHGGIRYARFRDAEDGYVRPGSLLPADVPRSLAAMRALDRRPRHHRNYLRRIGRDGAAQYEEARRVLVGESPRLRCPRNFQFYPAWSGW